MKEQLDNWVDAHRDEILESIQGVLRIPSVEATPETGAPFGRPIAEALDRTLELCERLGMRTENFDGYAGHAEFGEGVQIVGMLGHLDVVPVGNAWTRDPWGAAVEDGYLYGRGASDDKGPTYAALWGAKAVLDITRERGITLSRRIRLIFGCDEESGWECMDHYFGDAGQPKPDLAFTPDAEFPLVHAEKGALTVQARRDLPAGTGPRIVALQSGLRANMVPDTATATLAGDATALGELAKVLAGREDVTVEAGGEALKIVVRGRGAHASTPEQGENAAAKLLALLADLPGFDAAEREWMADTARRAAIDGSGCGIAGSDAVTGPLTLNLGVIGMEAAGEQRSLRATFNIRHPATWNTPETLERFTENLRGGGWQIEGTTKMDPLYVATDEEPVRTLMEVYRAHTGDATPPKTMGGRTYATAVAPRGVAFGPAMPGDPDIAHQPDERILVERLLQCARIYALALYELAK